MGKVAICAKIRCAFSRMRDSREILLVGRAAVIFWILLFLGRLSVYVTSAQPLPPIEELNALADFANANANLASNGRNLGTWQVGFDTQGNWTGGNPCQGFKGVRCWSSGNIRMLNLPLSGLNGTISPALGKLPVVTRLTLSQNSLTGDIASSIGPLKNLKRLRLQGNQLTGTIGGWVRRMAALEELVLANNFLGGTIPAGLSANFSVLKLMDVSHNQISGSIPDDLMRIPSLQRLFLNGNNLTGPVPASLASSTSASLNAVDLSGNRLSGSLPMNWGTPNLTTLDLSGNNFSGAIPLQLLNLTTLKNLSLAQNSFVGKIPVQLSARFGCSAFLGNPQLVLQDIACLKASTSLPPRLSPGLPIPGTGAGSATGPQAVDPPHPRKKSNGLGTLAIVALTTGDIALLIMSATAFGVFWVWWKRNDLEGGKVGVAGGGDGDESKLLRKRSGDLYKDGFITTSAYGGKSHSITTLELPAVPLKPALKSASAVNDLDPSNMDHSSRPRISMDQISMDQSSIYSTDDFDSDMVILDGTLVLAFDDLLKSTAFVLGTGSLGGVFMAALEDRQMLVIKKLEERVIGSEEAFGKQCARLAGVLHPNLLQLRAYCWSQQEKLLVFDYMRNGSVRSILHDTYGENAEVSHIKAREKDSVCMDWSLRLKIAVATARALAYLHDNDMAHGNIRASNVLIDDQLEPRLSDFGLKTLLHNPRRHRRKRRSDSEGETGYLSPEQRLGKGDSRGTLVGDVFSFGVLMLELLTGLDPAAKNNVDLPTWVQEMTATNRTVELFDPALVSMDVLPTQDVLQFLELAQACVSEDSSARPSITIALRSLEAIVPGSTAPRSFVQEDCASDDDHDA